MATNNAGSVWNPDNIRDVAEAVGISAISDEAVEYMTRDVEYRLAQILGEAIEAMRLSRRTTLCTQDIDLALKVLDQEPVYGYDTSRPLRFGEASIGPGQPLYYLEDEEVDLEKLINAPLPKVPREITYTAHWLSVEGVQPTIPQNPTPSDARNAELLPKGASSNPSAAALAGADNISVKPLVKHVVSRELQLYFEQVCAALLDENNTEMRVAALASLRADPSLQQLIPYFVHYISEKVTHNMKNQFVLEQMLRLVESLLANETLYMTPYVAALVPPVLTCLVSRKLGGGRDVSSMPLTNGTDVEMNGDRSLDILLRHLPSHFMLRELAANLLSALMKPAYTSAAPSLKPRLVKALLKHLLSPTIQPTGTYYGALRGLREVLSVDGIRLLLLKCMAQFSGILQEVLGDETETPREKEQKKLEVNVVVLVAVDALAVLEKDEEYDMNEDTPLTEGEIARLNEKLGTLVGQDIVERNRPALGRMVLAAGDADIEMS